MAIQRLALMAGLMLASCAAAMPTPAPVPQIPAIRDPGPPGGFTTPAGRFRFRGSLSQGGMLVGTAPPGWIGLYLDHVPVPLAPDGRFLIAFGRDHSPSATLSGVLARGGNDAETLTIAPGTYRIEALPIPRYQQPEAEFLKIRAGELDQIKAAREQVATLSSDGWQQPFIWPVIGRVSGAFGAQRVYNGEKGSYHTGEDIAVPTGTPVRAPADGVVVLAASGAPFTLEGHLLIVAHGMGLDSAFLHLSHIDVKVGDVVRQGQVIGESGMTGRATGPHLHWALTWRGERIDPKLVAGPMVS